ncbi:MAG: peptidase M15 [Betaproteobacteria bacterium]|nr:peptidase M15 [Betaproteobacteria bacterium]
MQLTQSFSLQTLIYSETAARRGIDNSPGEDVIPNLKRLAEGLEQVQSLLGHPIEISSAYRCPELNAAVGGAQMSQHTQGLAADIVCPQFGGPIEIGRAIMASNIVFDQCINEWGRWVHISFSPTPRGRVLSIYDSKDGYLEGLWNAGGERLA